MIQLYTNVLLSSVHPEEDETLTGQRLKLDDTATTAAIQNFVLGDCRMCLPMGSDFGQTITSVIHFENRT